MTAVLVKYMYNVAVTLQRMALTYAERMYFLKMLQYAGKRRIGHLYKADYLCIKRTYNVYTTYLTYAERMPNIYIARH